MSYRLRFPANGEDLPFQRYWAKKSLHGNPDDFVGTRFDTSTGEWSSRSGGTPEAHVIYGTPVYAAADGEVLAGWREYPNGEIGTNPYEGNQHRCTLGGNHLTIRTDDGHIVFYAHMQRNSIPESLCPNRSTNGGWLSMDPRLAENKIGDFPSEYLIDPALRRRVRVGDFLGRVGHTGNSGGPHLHIQVSPITEEVPGVFRMSHSIPLQWTGAIVAPLNGSGTYTTPEQLAWKSLDNEDLDPIVQEHGVLAIAPDEAQRPSFSSRAEDRLDLFVTGSDRRLHQKTWNGSRWSGWHDLGGILTSSPATASWSSGRIDCFARGRNLHLWHRYWNGSQWSDWIDHGGILTSAPSVVARAPDRIDVFARGRNGGLWQKSWNGGSWSSWRSLGGQLSSSPAAASWSASRIDCFARGRERQLLHRYWNGSQWSDWVDHGGTLTSAPTAVSRGSNRLDVFARGQNDHLWMIQWNGTQWSEWHDLGGILTSGPAAASWGPDRIDVSAIGRNGHVWHKYWSGGWSHWVDQGRP